MSGNFESISGNIPAEHDVHMIERRQVASDAHRQTISRSYTGPR